MLGGKKCFLSFLFFFVVFFLPILPVNASPYFAGKTITIVVGVGPGGGYDRMARIVQKFLPKYIPGTPHVIVVNMPGAASITAANYVYNVAKPDGLTIGAIQRGLPLAHLLSVEGVKYDIRKFSWLGSTSVETTVICVRSDLPYKTFHDLLSSKTQIILGGTGLGESSTHFTTLLKEFLGLNVKMIFYPSSPDVMLAIARKEVDGRPGSYSAMKPYIERGEVRPLIRGRAADPEVAHLPVDEDLTTDKKGKLFMAMRSSVELIGRPFVAPPKVPKDILTILQRAFASALADPELKKEAKRNMMEINYRSPEECKKILDHLFEQPREIIAEFSKYVRF